MKKHPFLQVDFASTVKLSPAEEKKLLKWFGFASVVLEDLLKKKIIPQPKVKQLSVSVLLCGDSRMKKLNLEHRGKDYVTDVLSFPSVEGLRNTMIPDAELFLGDLAICHQQALRQAREFNVSYFDEMIHLFFHGVIHLLGYDHEISEKEEKLMEEWEQTALTKFSAVKKKGS